MRGKSRNWPLPLAVIFMACGCQTTYPLPPHIPSSPVVPRSSSAVSAPLPDQGPLSFSTLVQLASAQNPDLREVQAQAEAARGRMVQAGLYPNPTIGWAASDVGNIPTSSAGKQGPTVGFTLVTGDKLSLARAAAGHAVVAADWNAITRWYETLVRLRVTFYDTLAAQQEVLAGEELVKIATQGLNAAEKLEKSGAGGRPDVLRARVELEHYRNRLEVAQRRWDAAWAKLAATVGATDLPSRPLLGSLTETVPTYTLSELKGAVQERSSELQAAQATAFEAGELLRRAQAEVVPNLDVQLHPFYDFTESRAGGDVSVSLPLPVFNKNQGNILTAQAEVSRAHQRIRQTEVRLAERVSVAYHQYMAARRQAENYEKRILPAAQESLRLVLLGYEAGDPKYDYTAVLQAQNALAQARLTYVQVLNDLQRTVSEIEGLMQREPEVFFLKPSASCAVNQP